MADDDLVLIAFDGSDTARNAARAAAELLASRKALVVTVWEPAIAYETTGTGSSIPGVTPALVDVGRATELEDELHARALRIAEEGAELARSAGMRAEPLTVAGDLPAAAEIVGVARERGAAVVVVGSRGLSGVRARLEGSTSSRVLREAPCPVLVVHAD